MPLLTDLGMTEQETRLVFEECRKQRLPFLDTLVSWGLIPKEVLSSRLRDELASRLAALLDLPAIEGFFVPQTLSFRSGFFYDLAEIEPPTPSEPDSDPLLHATKATLGPPPPLPPAVMALWPEVVRINGLVSAVILDRHSGQSVASEGQPSNASLLRRIARLFLLETDEPFEESLLMSNGHYHLTRSLSPDHLLYLSIDRATNPNIGFVRLLLSQHQQSADRR